MRPSVLWMLTAFVLALSGFALQYPEIYYRGRAASRMSELERGLGYLPNSWWEPIVWSLAGVAALMILFIAGLVWLQKKETGAPKRWRPPMEGD